MTLYKEQQKVRTAMNATFSGLTEDNFLAQRILAQSKGESQMKKKWSAALIFAIAALMLGAVALAAVGWSSLRQLLPRTLPIQEEKFAADAISIPISQTHNSNLITFGTVELYWAKDGLFITVPVKEADAKYVVCGSHDIVDDFSSWPPTHIWSNNTQIPADEWRTGREILEVAPQSGNWSASLRSEEGDLAVILGIDSPDNRKLPEGMLLTLRFIVHNWQTNEKEYVSLNLELPPMTMQQELLPR
ncbi:MAG: hypothetical protein IKM26_07435 [Clostridia bacterium]|nr:hypothetical protein [Clostridia bacterium]